MQKLMPVFLLLFLVACGDDPAPKQADNAVPETVDETTASGTTDSRVDAAHIDEVLAGYVERGDLVGVAALVYEDGHEAYFGAYGMADRDAQKAMTRDTIVRIFSMTKPISGVTLMTLYEDGLFDLDEPLSRYLPEYANAKVYVSGDGDKVVLKTPGRPISVRDITRHTAGFGTDDGSYVGRRLQEAQPLAPENSLKQMSEKLASVPLLYEPGTRWLYGPSVDVQARLVEVLAGKEFADVMRERVLEPLGMRDTQYVLDDEQRERLMVLYERSADGGFEPSPATGLTDFNNEQHALTPGGWGLTSTLDDYMRFARMLLNGGELDGVRILDAKTLALMSTDALPDTVTDRSWLVNKGQVGFGIDFAVRVAPPAHRKEASGAVGEFFWDGLANTLFWVDPENDITAVLFNQFVPWGKVDIQKDFRDAVYLGNPAASALNKAEPCPDARGLAD